MNFLVVFIRKPFIRAISLPFHLTHHDRNHSEVQISTLVNVALYSTACSRSNDSEVQANKQYNWLKIITLEVEVRNADSSNKFVSTEKKFSKE